MCVLCTRVGVLVSFHVLQEVCELFFVACNRFYLFVPRVMSARPSASSTHTPQALWTLQ